MGKLRPIQWYDDKLAKYYKRRYQRYEETYTITCYTNQPSMQWRFDIVELGLRVRLTCNVDGVVSVVEKRIRKRKNPKNEDDFE